MICPPGIILDNVSLCYGSCKAVDGLSGIFEKGSMTAVLGPNGGGKTTLFRAIMSQIKPSQGTISFKDLSQKAVAYLAQSQDLDLSFPLSVFDIVAMGGLSQMGMHRPLGPSFKDEVFHALEAVGLASFASQTLQDLSGGQRQRVFFARLSLQRAQVILLDEPFAAVDPYTIEDLLSFLYAWQSQGVLVIMISHDIDIVRHHFPKSLLLSKKPIAWGKTEDVLTMENMRLAKESMRKGVLS